MFKVHSKPILFFLSSVLFLTILSSFNLLLFHLTIEIFTIFIGIMIFLIAINSTSYSKRTILLVLGVAYLYVGILDFLHALSFEGIGNFEFSINRSSQYWMGARLIESFNMLIVFAFFRYQFKAKYAISHLVNLVFVVLIVLAVNYNWLPLFYIEGLGQTSIKMILACVTIALLFCSFYFVKKSDMKSMNKYIMFIVISFKILSEIMLTQYTTVNESFVIIGHLMKFLSYGGLYIIFISEVVRNPYQNVYKLFQNKEEELRVLSERDSLTGLYNHSLTFKKIEEMINLVGKDYESVTVGLIDIDDFKIVNDTYGHQKGDEVLVRFAQLLLSFKMLNSIVGRYGGDEFVVALPNLKRVDIKDRFRILGAAMDKFKEELGVDITFSAGIAIYHEGDTAKDLIYKADIKMYESKRNGKNQLTMWENEIK